jgi:ATP-binding cassette subfamily C exporter for protease/lipase
MLREGSTQLFGPREEVFAALRQTSVLPTVGTPTLSAVRGRE